MNYNILELSNTGFKTKEGWFTCDKFKVLNKPIFKGLKIGDVITNLQFKDKYVISFDFPKLTTDILESDGVISPKLLSSPSVQDKQILKGQCLNIAFERYNFQGFNTTDKAVRTYAYDLADTLFKELKERGY